MNRILKTTANLLLILLMFTPYSTLACTGIILKSLDGVTIPARTMEFSFDIRSNIVIVPAGTKITTLSLDDNNEGFTYEAKYGFAGANCLEKPIIVDGVNEKGLYFGAFYCYSVIFSNYYIKISHDYVFKLKLYT